MCADFEFVKYHGCGNDFILKDELTGPRTPDAQRSALAKKLWNRNYWVGADGVIFVEPAPGTDGSMRLFEPAGNEADMCGNGLRCIAAFLMEKLGKDTVSILTRDGVKVVVRRGDNYEVDMGPVRATRADLSKYITDPGAPDDSMLSIPLEIDGNTVEASILYTGEPHIVVPTERLDSLDVKAIGEEVNADRARFPLYVNINMITVDGPHEISIRTYERGVFDETLACGTGTTACAAAALMLGLVQPGPVTVNVRGGSITIEVDDSGNATMTGPAVKVFRGSIPSGGLQGIGVL
jgi:diaminopimelate epimerase